MIADLLAAVQAALPATVSSALVDGTGLDTPLVVLNAVEVELDNAPAAATDARQIAVGAFCVADGGASCLALVEAVASSLVPSRLVDVLPMTGWHAQLSDLASDMPQADRSLVDVRTNQHPVFAWVRLMAHCQPLT